MIYRESQLIKEGLKYFQQDLLATNVWIKKYALKINEQFVELSPVDTIKRVAKEIYRMEQKFPNPLSYEEIYETLENFKHFIFAGSILFGLGNPNNVSLGNCFFINNSADSYGGIFNIDEAMAQLMKRRAGVGVTIEHLRPKEASVRNSASTSTGSVSFMERYSNTTREVAQDGRRGALMITMHVHHPDIIDFINAKKDLTKITGANISVKMSDEFMKAAELDEDFLLHWPIQNKQPIIKEVFPYNKIHKLEDGTYVKRVRAKDIWDQIIEMAHANAEPGIIFWDNVINESPADCYAIDGFETQGTNPCGEVPLSPFDSCRLGSVNLFNMIINAFKSNAMFDWDLLAQITRRAQRFMDDIVSLEEEKIYGIIAKIDSDPEDIKIKRNERDVWTTVLEVLQKGRRTGVGVLGLGDAMAAMGMKFGTKEATLFAENIQKVMAVNSYRESVKLAKERGAFPIWDADKEAGNPFIIRVISQNFDNKEYEDYLQYGRRNIANLSIAPTGSLAIVAQTTSGVEPVFKCFYLRRRKINPNEENVEVSFIDEQGDSWEEYFVMHKPFERWAINEGINPHSLNEEQLEMLVAESPWDGSESHTIDYFEKVEMQGSIQKWIDHSISITHNLPAKITVAEVNEIYLKGWKAGCKGITIYREGSRSGVLISNKEVSGVFPETIAPKRPKILPADYYVGTANGTKFAVVIGKWPDGPNKGKPYEIFAFENPPSLKNTTGETIKIKKGHYRFINGEFEIPSLELAAERTEEKSLSITASMLLRHGVPIEQIIKTIKKIDENITSFSSVVRRYLSRYIESIEAEDDCPHCGDKLITESGCVRCISPACGFEKCG